MLIKNRSGDKDLSVVYLDGNVIEGVDMLLAGIGKPTPLDVPNTEALVQAIVLYDCIVCAFNLLIPAMEEQRQVEDLIRQNDLGGRLPKESEETLRETKGFGAFFAGSERKTIGAIIHRTSQEFLDDEKAASASVHKTLTDFRKAITEAFDTFRYEGTEDVPSQGKNIIQMIPGEVKDLVSISGVHGMDLIVMPEYLPMVYPDLAPLSVSTSFYRALADAHKVSVDSLLSFSRPRAHYIPPLLSIVLDKCKGRGDFLDVLWQVRQDFTPFREAATQLESRITNSEKLKYQIEALNEYENVIRRLTRRYRTRDTRLLQGVWKLFDDPEALKIGKKAADVLIDKARERSLFSRFKGFIDLWSSCMSVRKYTRLFERTFGEVQEGQEGELRAAADFLERVVRPARLNQTEDA